MKHVAYIGAKRDSSRLPGKNMMMFHGKPLIQWTIEAAQESKLDEVVVYGDWDEALRLAEKLGTKTDCTPAGINDKQSGHFLAVGHAVQAHPSDQLWWLQATSPLRTSLDINHVHSMLGGDVRAVATMTGSGSKHPLAAKLVRDDGFMEAFGESEAHLPQEFLPKCYYPNGAIFTTPTEAFMKTLSLWSVPVKPYLMGEIGSIDIDTLGDFKLAEWYYTMYVLR